MWCDVGGGAGRGVQWGWGGAREGMHFHNPKMYVYLPLENWRRTLDDEDFRFAPILVEVWASDPELLDQSRRPEVSVVGNVLIFSSSDDFTSLLSLVDLGTKTRLRE